MIPEDDDHEGYTTDDDYRIEMAHYDELDEQRDNGGPEEYDLPLGP